MCPCDALPQRGFHAPGRLHRAVCICEIRQETGTLVHTLTLPFANFADNSLRPRNSRERTVPTAQSSTAAASS
jgi:hypothetical protein